MIMVINQEINMQKQEKIYAIRHLSFFYTDEWYESLIDYTDHTGHITDLFDNKEDAISKWKQLEYSFSHKVDFYNILYCEYSDGDDTDDQKELLAQKSVDELFEIIQKRECHVYGLYEYPKQLKQLVLFNKKSQQYDFCDLRMDDDDVDSNIFIPSNFIKNSPLNDEISPPIHDIFIEHNIDLKGTLEELSDTPLLLQCLIEENPDIKFYPPDSLKLQFKDLAQVNALLKKPIKKEVRYLSIEEIYQLEKSLNQTYLKGIE